MFYYFVLDRLNEVDCNSVISLKQRSTCRNVSYFDTNTLCHKNMKNLPERKTNGCLCYSHQIYEEVINLDNVNGVII